ncbi:MAG TPA: 3-methyl-2-oxobutanoate hydroxymethyltransferase, partial [Oligoflexia bacterium]|nr:3-methyl-2-oxobutanoate hydroxymethyltransferase [Oligoflexia bacterium]
MSSQVRVTDLLRKKDQNEKIVVVTAYDYTFARLVDVAGVDVILVGDSLGTVIQGCATTLPVTLEEMIYHTRAVVRGAKQALVIADMPFMSYQLGPKEALAAAGRVMKETGAAGVKLEGGESAAQTIRAIVQAGIPVMAHAGLQPQSVHQLGGYRVQGRSEDDAVQVLRDAVAVEEAGAFSVVL